MMYYTVTCNYFATGEGATDCILIGLFKNREEAMAEFKLLFGDYFAIGAVIEEGVVINMTNSHLIPDLIKKIIDEIIKGSPHQPSNFNYFTSFHANYS